ncbi:hypothetical protein K4K58_007993 [Colletotrichum sp. SAR11_239]|nr:hypothetical protein K4K58_007993 [Colletotrichum sp. SAR11_239]
MPSEMDNTGVAEGNGSSLPDTSCIDRLEEKLAILKAISETEIPSDTPNKPPRRIDQTGVKENVWAAFMVATMEELQQFLDFKLRTSYQQTKERDGGKCALLHTTLKEAVHIYPVAQTKAAAACKNSLYALGFIWGGNTCDKFKHALSIKDFDTPKNMITLDNAPRHLWDTGKITFSPVLVLPNRIDLAVRVLEPLDWGKRKGAGSELPEGIATDPRIKMRGYKNLADRIIEKPAERPVEVSFVSADTQYRINDGHRFNITSDDSNMLPNAELLKLRDRIMTMMTLNGGGDVDEDVLSSSSGGDDAPRVLFGDGDVEIDLKDKVLEWSERAGEELAPLTIDEANKMAWTSSAIQQSEGMGEIFPPESQPEDQGESQRED